MYFFCKQQCNFILVFMQEQNKQIQQKQAYINDAVIDILTEIQTKSQKDHNLHYLKNIKRNIEIPDNDKIKIDVSKTQYPLIKLVALNRSWKIWSKQSASKQQVNIFWNDTYVTEEFVRKLKPYQKLNHFPSSHELGKKNFLTENIKKLKKLLPQQYKFYPQTFNLPQQYSKLKDFEANRSPFWYIVKPTCNSQGRGIYLTQKINNTKEELVVQEYIDKPLIIENTKFDLRIYVMIKSFTPLKIFIFNQGLARFATENYQSPNQLNQNNFKMHLTNYAINKLNPAYIFNKDEKQDYLGHKRSISSIMQTLQKLGCDVRKLQMKIDEIIVKTILSAHIKIADSYKACRSIQEEPLSLCFQVLGFDVLIDQNFQPYLLQVNHTPSFMTETPLDSVIKRCLILDTLNLVRVDPLQKQNYFKMKQNQFQQLQSKQRRNFSNRQKLVYQQEFQNQNLGGFRKIYPIAINHEQYFNGLFYLKKQNSQQKIQQIQSNLWNLYQKYNRIITKMADKGKKRPIEISIQERIENVVSSYAKYRITYQENKEKQLQRQQQRRRKIAQTYQMFINKNYENRKSLDVTIHQLDQNQKLQQIYKMDKINIDSNSQVCLKNREVVAIKKHINSPKKLTSPVKLKNVQIDFHQQKNPKGKYPLINPLTQNLMKQKQLQGQSNNNLILFSPPHIRHHQVLKLRGTNKSKSLNSKPVQAQKPTTSLQIASRINKIVIPTIKLQKLKYSQKARSVDSQINCRYKDVRYMSGSFKHDSLKSAIQDEKVFCVPKINQQSQQQIMTSFRHKNFYEKQKQLHSAGFYSRRTMNVMRKNVGQNNKNFNINDSLPFNINNI